jgi:hypothetical protein
MEQFYEYVTCCMDRDSKPMGLYTNKTLKEGNGDLLLLYERTKAADQLGYEVHLVAQDNGLYIGYYKKLPPHPDNVYPED